MAAAHALGLGTRWFGGFALDGGGQSLKDLLAIPAEVEIAAVTPLGYPADATPIRPRVGQTRQELAAFRRGDQPALARLLKGKLPLEAVVHDEQWVQPTSESGSHLATTEEVSCTPSTG